MDKKRPDKSVITPPRWADKFLEWYCVPEYLDEVQGDLYEAFQDRIEKYGPAKARLLFVKEVFQFCRPSHFKKSTANKNFSSMSGLISNYFTVSLRNAAKNKLFSMINTIGLAIGIAAFFLIMQYVRFERSYDKFHVDSDRIYRVLLLNNDNKLATNHPGAGPALKADFAEVEEYARVVPQSIFMGDIVAWSYVDENGNTKVFNEDKVYNVDTSFLTMFSFPFVFGDPQSALSDPHAVVISRSVAEKFFGPENPLGKTLYLNGRRSFTVTGVFEDVPENSHIKFDILVSFFHRDGWGGGWNHNWDWRWPEYYTYVRLAPKTEPHRIEAKLPAFISKYLGDVIRDYKWEISFRLQPITDIHLKSPNLGKEPEVQGKERTVYFLTLIAGLVLIIAWINYINLSTSRSIERAREVGLRKVAGAGRGQLITQFLLESVVINLLAIALSFVLIAVALPYFNQLAGKNIGATVWDLFLFREPWLWLVVASVFLAGSFLAGLYPAFVLSSFRAVTTLKGNFFHSRSGIVMRKILVAIQFMITVALIAGTIMVHTQVSFMRDQDLGYAKNQLLVVKSPRVYDSTIVDRQQTFQTELKRKPNITHVAPSSEIPGKMIAQLNFIRKKGEGNDSNSSVFHFFINHNFLDTYKVELLAGRNFREGETLNLPEEQINPQPVLVNNRVVEQLGYRRPEEAINQLVTFGLGSRDWQAEIVGVMGNHHQRSLKNGYDPILFFPVADFLGEYLTLNITMEHPAETISFIERQYDQAFPGNQFEYFFLDDYFDRQYAADRQFGKVFGLFSTLTLVVACLGLFGLSTFIISRRTKEVAVRKALGATISHMVYLFSKDFVKLIVVANVITLPLVLLALRKWLSGFAFQASINWAVFVVPVVILVVISLGTVGFQTVKTASANLIKHLRQE